jgi:hypothetical protein
MKLKETVQAVSFPDDCYQEENHSRPVVVVMNAFPVAFYENKTRNCFGSNPDNPSQEAPHRGASCLTRPRLTARMPM